LIATLSARLKEMEKNRLITRKVYDETPLKVEYFLTEKGLAMKPILDQMACFFSLKYCSKDVSKDGKPRNLQDVYH
jgi:DNA-binding HxlR family transcriptional regulator